MQKMYRWMMSVLLAMCAMIGMKGYAVHADDLAPVEEDFVNEEGYCGRIYLINEGWRFEDMYDEEDFHYVAEQNVLTCLKNLKDELSVQLIVNVTPTDSQWDIINQISALCKVPILSYIFNFTCDKDYTLIIDESITRLDLDINTSGVGTFTVNYPCSNIESGRVLAGNKNDVVFHGDIYEFYTSDSTGDFTVEGSIMDVQSYGATCSSMASIPYNGTLTVTGMASGNQMGAKYFKTPDMGTLYFDFPIYVFENQTGKIFDKGTIVCDYKEDDLELTEDMFRFEYQTYQETNGNTVWGVTARFKDASICPYPSYTYLLDGYGTGANPDFTVSDVREGSELYISYTDACPNHTLVISQNLSDVTVASGNVRIDGNVDYLYVNPYKPYLDLQEVDHVSVQINGTVNYLNLSGKSFGTDVYTGATGTVANGCRMPIHGDVMQFENIGPSTMIMNRGDLSIMMYGAGQELGVMIPSEQGIANLTDSSYATVVLEYDSEENLTQQEQQFILESIENASQDEVDMSIVDVLDMKIEGFEVDAQGNILEDTLVNIKQLSQEVDFTYSVPDEGTYAIVRLHDDGTKIEATALATEEGGDSISFYTDQFSKYVLVKLNQGSIKIDKKEQTISCEVLTYDKTYGDAAFSLAITNNGTKDLVYASSNEKVATIDVAGKVTIVGVGTAKITVYAKGNDRYQDSNKLEIVIRVNKKQSIITLKAKTATYTGKAISIAKASVKGSTGKVTYTYYTDSKCKNKTTSKNGAKTKGGAPMNAGTYYVKAKVAATATAEAATSKAVKLVIKKAKAIIKTKTTSKSYKEKDVKKAAKSFSIGASVTGKGKLTYKKVSGSKALSIDKSGKVKIAKGTKKGTYSMKVKVSAAASTNYLKADMTFTIKVIVK